MEIVSSQSDREFALSRIEGELGFEYREFAANALRVIRGNGRPFTLLGQMTKILRLTEAYRELQGFCPSSHQVQEWMDPFPYDMARPYSELREGLETTASGALQFAASSLLGQAPQKASGEQQMRRGIDILNARSERMRPEYAAEFSSRKGAPRRKQD